GGLEEAVPLPARHCGTAYCRGVPGGTDEQRREGPCGALQTAHQAYRRLNSWLGTRCWGNGDEDILQRHCTIVPRYKASHAMRDEQRHLAGLSGYRLCYGPPH